MLRSSGRPRRGLVPWPMCLVILSLVTLPIGLCKPVVAIDKSRGIFLHEEPPTLLPRVPGLSVPPSLPTKIRFPPASIPEFDYLPLLPTTTPLAPRKESGHTVQSLPPESSWSSWLQPDKETEQASLDPQNKAHKIMAKSIFVAPDYTPTCKNGLVYSERFKQCVANVYVNVKAIHDQLLLARLNKHYFPNGTRIKPTRTTYRPTELSEPAVPDPPAQPPRQPVGFANRFVAPVVAVSEREPAREEQSKNQEPVVVVVYEEKNSTKKEADATSESLDYKTSSSARPVLNRSHVLDRTTEDGTGRPTEKKEDSQDPTEDVTMPTTPAASAVSYSEYESLEVDKPTTRQELGRRENTGNTEESAEGTRFETDTTIHTVAPLDSETSADHRAYADDRLEDDDDGEYGDEEAQPKPSSNDYDRYYDTTEEPDRDELLEPGEAGMTIPAKSRDIIRKNHKQMPTTVDFEETASTMLEESTVVPSVSTSTFSDDDSTTKPESTDYVTITATSDIPSDATTQANKEETLTTLRAESLAKSTTGTHSTQVPVTSTTTENGDTTAETKETFGTDRDLVTESGVTFFVPHSTGMTTSFGRIKVLAHPAKVIETPQARENDDDPKGVKRLSAPEFLRRRPVEMQAATGEPTSSKNDSNIPLEFKDQIADSSRLAFADFRRIPMSSMADETNSIQSQGTYKSNSPRSNVLVRQKQALGGRRVSRPALRMNRQQQAQSGSRSQRKPPTLWDFWKNLPLKKDPSLYPAVDRGLQNGTVGGHD